MLLTRLSSLVLYLMSIVLAAPTRGAAPVTLVLRSNDVVAFVGGSDVAAAQFNGHLETLLTVKFPGARFRNFGWEGDTVFAQPREIGFPPLGDHLQRAGATVVFLEFGRAEALGGKRSVSNFLAAYEKLIEGIARQTTRIILVTPVPFESAVDPLPDLSQRNSELSRRAEAIRTLGRKHGLPVVDLFSHFRNASHAGPRLTENGLQITPRGYGLIAVACARQLGFGEVAAQAGECREGGAWSNSQMERLRASVLEKNRLWFNYWRPQNWAFLGGDRVTQPSSRDHRDPKMRWFPAEMEKYLPLIREKEAEMEKLAATIEGGSK